MVVHSDAVDIAFRISIPFDYLLPYIGGPDYSPIILNDVFIIPPPYSRSIHPETLLYRAPDAQTISIYYSSLSFDGVGDGCTRTRIENIWNRGYSQTKHKVPAERLCSGTLQVSVASAYASMSVAGPSASSPITQVQQGPANVNLQPQLLTRLLLDLRGRRFEVDRETIMNLPESVLLCLFPNGLVLSRQNGMPDEEGNEDEEDVYSVDVSVCVGSCCARLRR